MQTLGELVADLERDGSLDADDLAVIARFTASAADALREAKEWANVAHVHDEPHVAAADDGARCCDCRRELVSDAGSVRILVCPKLHNRRPPDLAPTNPDGAVECGRSEPRD
jgi:hypothetical protein